MTTTFPEPFIRRICVGVNWGRNKDLKLVPLFTGRPRANDVNANFYILTIPGHNAWMGVGHRAYVQARHVVLNLSRDDGKSGYDTYTKCQARYIKGGISPVIQHQGRLIKTVLQKWRKLVGINL